LISKGDTGEEQHEAIVIAGAAIEQHMGAPAIPKSRYDL
jgi:hypothetical protein